MSFHKVVKAPAKRAHIKNYPHKKSEARDRRVKWLLEYLGSLISAVLLHTGEQKLYYYTQFSTVKQELKELGCYDERATWCIIREARWEHGRYYRR